MTERDPRKDPRPGDIVQLMSDTGTYWMFEVVEVDDGALRFRESRARVEPISRWQVLTHYAKIVLRAAERAPAPARPCDAPTK